METILALPVIAAAVYFMLKGVDVRLVLFTAGLALCSLTLKPWIVFDAFRTEMGNLNTIGPICSAMGYAFVLRATGCDREMVRLLIAPLRRVKWLLIPGGCAVGFVTNIAITSQTAAAAAVGPVLVPLLLAAGFHPIIAAATLVLGCSGGGNLYNPGDADLVALQTATNAPMGRVLDAMLLPLLTGFVAAVVAFMFFSKREPKDTVQTNPFAELDETKPIHWIKALLPPLPVALVFLMQPGFSPFPSLNAHGPGLPVPHAMVACTAIVLLIYRQQVSAQTRTFFEGMGYGYIHVISLIITATCFIAGMTEVGLTQKLVGLVSSSGFFGKLASELFPGMLGVLSGSGMGPSVAFSKAVLPAISATDLPGAVNLGVLGAVGASFGRTMSPVAAVVIFTATLVNVTPLQIVRRTGPPLLLGALAALVVVLLR